MLIAAASRRRTQSYLKARVAIINEHAARCTRMQVRRRVEQIAMTEVV